jgi:DNA modification methylase
MLDLRHGECIEVMRSLPDQSVDMVLCDLPYGTTRNAWDSIIPFDDLWREYRRLSRGAIVLTAAQPFTSALIMSNPKEYRYSWVWVKSVSTGFLNAKKQPLRKHEDVLVFSSKVVAYNPQMEETGKRKVSRRVGTKTSNYGSADKETFYDSSVRYPTTILEMPSRTEASIHPTQKPVALMEYLIRTYTNEGDTVLDNCMGSGTTGIACARSGRNFIGIERDDAYFKIAHDRVVAAYCDNL